MDSQTCLLPLAGTQNSTGHLSTGVDAVASTAGSLLPAAQDSAFKTTSKSWCQDLPSIGVLGSGLFANTTSTYSNCSRSNEAFRPGKKDMDTRHVKHIALLGTQPFPCPHPGSQSTWKTQSEVRSAIPWGRKGSDSPRTRPLGSGLALPSEMIPQV